MTNVNIILDVEWSSYLFGCKNCEAKCCFETKCGTENGAVLLLLRFLLSRFVIISLLVAMRISLERRGSGWKLETPGTREEFTIQA